jgi:DNA-binding LytR/AlgR family response regulator
MKLRCLIIDDEPLGIDVIAGFVAAMPSLQLVDVTTDPKEGLKRILAGEVDLVLLDIEMPGFSGIDILREAGGRSQFILTTAYPDYALQGYEFSVVDYLLKPISFDRFEKAVTKVKAVGVAEPVQDFFFVKSEYKLLRFDFAEIVYLESLRDYVAIHTVSKQKVLTLQTMGSFETSLPANYFVRIHKSYIVSFPKITSIARNKVWVGDVELPVGDTYRDRLNKFTRK